MKDDTVSIPDGLGAFLQQKFGGKLLAPYSQILVGTQRIQMPA